MYPQAVADTIRLHAKEYRYLEDVSMTGMLTLNLLRLTIDCTIRGESGLRLSAIHIHSRFVSVALDEQVLA